MVLGLLKRIFGAGRTADTWADVQTGKAVLTGTIKAQGDLVRSPLKGVTCVAFYYRAWYKAQARGKYVERVVKDAEVYAPRFALEMEGGSVVVEPPKPGSFDAAEHRTLLGRGFAGFQATEQVIRPGDRVRVQGRVRRDGDALVIRPRQIDMLGTADDGRKPGRPAGRRKKRK